MSDERASGSRNHTRSPGTNQRAELRADEGQGGAVTLIQRFGPAANLNIHLHCLVLDGVYRCGADGAPAFVEAGTPTDDDLHALLQTVIARLMKMLTHRGVLIEEKARVNPEAVTWRTPGAR